MNDAGESPSREVLGRGKRSVLLLLLLGLLLRELLGFWTGHPYDFEVWLRTGYVVAHGTNPYLAPAPAIPGLSFGYPNTDLPLAAYLPFWPGVFGASYDLWSHIGGGNRFVLYALLKQGPILSDLGVAYLLYRVVRHGTGAERPALAALAFWVVFPYAIVISAVWGQLDALTTAIVLGTLLPAGSTTVRRNLLYGLGTFVKWVTAIFLPLELFRQRGLRRGWPVLDVAFVVVLTGVAFLLAGWSFGGIGATTFSESQGGGNGMNWAILLETAPIQRAVVGLPNFYTYAADLWIPALVLAGAYASRWTAKGGFRGNLRASLFVMTTFLLFRWGLYEQYFLYPFALLVADVYSTHPGRRRFLYFLIALASAGLLVNNDLGIWFASPVTPLAFSTATSFDASSLGGSARYYTLLAVAGLVTVSLVQLLWVTARDVERPEPWLFWPFLRRSWARPPISSLPPRPDAPE